MNVLKHHTNNLEFEYFLSSADDQLRTDYYTGLNKVLKKYGVDGVVLNTTNSLSSTNTIIVLAKNSFGDSVGGIRIEIKTDDNPLPIEKISTRYKEILNSKIKNLYHNGTKIAEICGLWVDSDVRNYTIKGKLGPLLSKTAFEVCEELEIDHVTAITPAHTTGIFLSLGFTPDSNVPSFAYPDDRYITTITWRNIQQNNQLQNSIQEMRQ